MFQDLDAIIGNLLKMKAEGSSKLAHDDTKISFDLPDADWRSNVNHLTVNCYLYDVRENSKLRTNEPIVQRSANNTEAARRRAPVRIDCAYCITAWSAISDSAPEEDVLEEHELLGDVLKVLLKHPTIPEDVIPQPSPFAIPPYPTIIAAPDGVKNPPEFGGALDQQLKPSLNYVVTLAVMLDEPVTMVPVVAEDGQEVLPQQPPAVKVVVPGQAVCGQTLDLQISGLGTHFRSYPRVRFDPGDGITVEQPVVANSESLSVPVTIATDAPVGWRNVIVTSGNEIAEREKGFKVNES